MDIILISPATALMFYPMLTWKCNLLVRFVINEMLRLVTRR